MVHSEHVGERLGPDLRRLPPLRLRHGHRLQPDRRLRRQALDQAHDDGRGGHLPRGGHPRGGPCRQHLEVTPSWVPAVPAGRSPDRWRCASARGRWVVAATVLGSGMALLDSTVVGIALPSIDRDVGGGVGTLQWVVTGYTLTLAAFLLLGGSLGDRYGRRRDLLRRRGLVRRPLGLLRPGAGSGLPRGRPACVQGVGGALLAPASLAILQASFRAEDRARAIGAWSGLTGVAAAAGPARRRLPDRGGLVALGLLHQPPDGGRGARRHRTPRPRVARPRGAPAASTSPGPRLAAVFLAGLTYGLIEGPARGWSSPPVVVGPGPGRWWPDRPSCSSSADAPARCSRSASSAPASSAAPTRSPSPSTAPWAAPCSCSRWSSRS